MHKEDIKQMIEKELHSQKQAFGRGQFYQSFSLLDLEGQRPTDIRLQEYGVEEILNEKQMVLDIGCNCGFLDMTIANAVKSVTGIENNKSLVNIAEEVAKYLKISNVQFIAVDFNEWEKEEKNTYDVIFSFAVHYWLKVTPQSYTKRLYDLLSDGGYIFFESQNLKTVDLEFNDYYKQFLGLGMSVVKEGIIKDDGIIERIFYVLKK